MKNIFIFRVMLWIILGAISIITAFKEIQPIQFFDLFSIFGLEITLISLSTLLIVSSKFESYSLEIRLKDPRFYARVLIQTLHVFKHLEIVLINILFFLYVFKAYDFNSYMHFLILISSILLNNFFIILFHLFIIHFSKLGTKKKALVNTFIIITFIIVMTNLPIINDSHSVKEFLYYFPLPGAFLLPINPNVSLFSPLLLVPILLMLLPFVLLFNYSRNESKSD